MEKGTFQLKSGLAEMLKGGVIMDVTTPEQAKIAQEAGVSPPISARPGASPAWPIRPSSCASWTP